MDAIVARMLPPKPFTEQRIRVRRGTVSRLIHAPNSLSLDAQFTHAIRQFLRADQSALPDVLHWAYLPNGDRVFIIPNANCITRTK